MTDFEFAEHPHRRLNALTGDWVLVSPHRSKRPWQGAHEPAPIARPAYDPQCFLCPGTARGDGGRNPDYTHTFVFTNDYAALLPTTPSAELPRGLVRFESVQGTCRVICFSPRHDLTLAEMPVADIRRVIDLWADQVQELGQRFRWVQVFENKGEMMGCSNPHPHGQIWAGSVLPNVPYKEEDRQQAYFKGHGAPLLLDYLTTERDRQKRVVIENDHWCVLTPFWAVWPFESLLVPKRHVQRLPDLTNTERGALAEILKRHLTRYDNLFQTSFPYTMGWHGAPTDAGTHEHWQLHAHFFPPLLRSATVKKFMVGYEMLAEAQRDITPEQAAQRLRDQSEVHYSGRPPI